MSVRLSLNIIQSRINTTMRATPRIDEAEYYDKLTDNDFIILRFAWINLMRVQDGNHQIGLARSTLFWKGSVIHQYDIKT